MHDMGSDWQNTGRAFPNLGAIGAGLDKNDFDAKWLKFISNRLGPTFKCPLKLGWQWLHWIPFVSVRADERKCGCSL